MPQRLRERPAAAEAEHRAARHFDATRDQPGQDARQADHAAEQYQLVRPRDRSVADGDELNAGHVGSKNSFIATGGRTITRASEDCTRRPRG